jgi:hypothetical protein
VPLLGGVSTQLVVPWGAAPEQPPLVTAAYASPPSLRSTE